MDSRYHLPVLLNEVLEALTPHDKGVYIDGTLGGGGHSGLILDKSTPTGILLGIDRDKEALAEAKDNLAVYGRRFIPVQGKYSQMADIAADHNIASVDGVLLDIGVSSHQLDEAERGFSYMQDGPLDMRMDQESGKSAKELINEADAETLKHILYDFGEEKWAARIVEFIIQERATSSIENTYHLVEIIKKAIPRRAREKDQHPAKRSFQALRIAVNSELDELSQGLEAGIKLLKPGGRLAVITFHSLEDRIVKDRFRLFAKDCLCPPELPVCVCGHKAEAKIVTRKPITATAEEISVNPRSRSANLRVIEALGYPS